MKHEMSVLDLKHLKQVRSTNARAPQELARNKTREKKKHTRRMRYEST